MKSLTQTIAVNLFRHNGANVDMHVQTTDRDKRRCGTPLSIAIQHDLLDMVDLLLQNDNTDVNATMSMDYTPLMSAVLQGDARIVKKLLQRKDNILLWPLRYCASL